MKIQPGKEAEYQSYVEINSQDGYSKAVVTYGERWAESMEKELDQGAEFAPMAETTSHSADIEGITGFMYGCAVKALSHFWIHGEELRRWHNKATQIGTEGDRANESGGVLNPALLCIEPK